MAESGAPGARLPARRIGRVAGPEGGPVLVCVAAVHGNEPAGAEGIRRVLARLEADPAGLRGELIGLLGNRMALAAGRRFLEQDLNRLWTAAQLRRLEALPPGAGGPDEEEQRELDRELRAILAGTSDTRGPVHLLDLHTTSGPGPAFAVLDDTLPNRAFALELPVPIVLGFEEELPGTLLFYFSGERTVAIGFEAGQHGDPRSADRAEAAVWIALEACGALARDGRPEPAAARRLLAEATGALPHVVEVRYRHAIRPADRFRMAPGFVSFQPVRSGQPLASDAHGTVAARETGLLLLPLYQEQGDDGYFLARPVRPAWLALSARLRGLRLERRLDLLPGIARDPDRPDLFRVDRRVARWLVRELFHLLGFRREGEEGRHLLFRRRAHDW